MLNDSLVELLCLLTIFSTVSTNVPGLERLRTSEPIIKFLAKCKREFTTKIAILPDAC
jgi:hypothetical protein